jgi:hypothetical protein
MATVTVSIIDRRAFLAGSLAVFAAPLAAGAQQAGKVWRIGLLDLASAPASSSRWQALRDRLRELGYVEGQDVRFESRWSDGVAGVKATRAFQGGVPEDLPSPIPPSLRLRVDQVIE